MSAVVLESHDRSSAHVTTSKSDSGTAPECSPQVEVGKKKKKLHVVKLFSIFWSRHVHTLDSFDYLSPCCLALFNAITEF